MDLRDKLRSFFGLPRRSEGERNFSFFHDENEFPRIMDMPEEEPSRRGFNIFSDPLHMHQYFEHQMNEILKSFGFQQFGDNSFSFDFGSPEHSFHLPLEEPSEERPLRDHFLKKGYEKPSIHNKTDKDIDGKVDLRELDSVISGDNNSIVPKDNRGLQLRQEPQNFFFGQSFSSKTVRNADGSVEMHKTRTDSEGNTETTVTRKWGDKEYSVITKRDKTGREETIENLVNMDEAEKNNLLRRNTVLDQEKPSSFFPFDKFFK